MRLRYLAAKFLFSIRGIRRRIPPNDLKFDTNFKFPYYKLTKLDGSELDLIHYSGKKILIVNVASRCGFTPQYKELEELYRKHNDNLLVVGVPSNQFKEQEPGTAQEILQFCDEYFGITFPLLTKQDVKGKNKSELYAWLTDPSKNGWNTHYPDWNFSKFLIDENGFLQAYFPPQILPEF